MVLFLFPPEVRVSPPSVAKPSTFSVVEFAVDAGTDYRNPFDPTEVSVDGTFTGRGGVRIVLPAFWDGKGFWLRFCPTKEGDWSLTATVVTSEGRRAAPVRRFQVLSSKDPGFVRPSRDNVRYFRLDSGASFVPIGLNLCWPDGKGIEGYDARFAKLRSVGGNFARIWTTQERALETKAAGLGRYDLRAADDYDRVFRLASEHGIRLMWTFDDYRVLAKTDFFNAHWDKSPYNAVNGGPLKEPTDFFADPLCRRLYRQKLRYLVARYGAFPSLAFWELWNEQDNIPKPGVPTEWFRAMTDDLKALDPYDHPITTSYSWDDKPEVWRSPALGLTQRHLYGQGDTVDFVGEIEKNARKLEVYDKPRLIGEFGITWKEPDIALDKARKGTPLHDALWASVMTGDAGGALTWWWDNYLEPLDLWSVFTGIARFVAPIDFARRDFRPLNPSLLWGRGVGVRGRHGLGAAQGGGSLTTLGLQDAKTGETLLWLHDPASNWKADAQGLEPQTWRDVRVSVPARGRLSAEIWDTRKGKVVFREELTPKEGLATVRIPEFTRDVAVRLVRR